MKRKKLFTLVIVSVLLYSLSLTSANITPNQTAASVTVSNQPVVDNKVTVDEVIYNTTGWIVIHADNSGAPGSILGYSNVSSGTNTDVVVALSGTITNRLYAMLHTDAGVIGTFEFPSGADVPVTDSNNNVITPGFDVTGFIDAAVDVINQPIVFDNVTINEVISPGPGWMVIHADNAGSPGSILGHTALTHGVNSYVVVNLATSGRTSTLYAMLHTDNGTRGTYEFPGADGPVKDGDGNVITPAFTVLETLNASVTVANQAIVDDSVVIEKVVSDGPGWLVIHADNAGSPGAILGQTNLTHGINNNVIVELSDTGRTTKLFAMLHRDKGLIGTFEFPGVDGPVKDHLGAVITPPFDTTGTLSSSVTVVDQEFVGDTVTIASVISLGPGWMVIHADNNGAPGSVLGHTALVHGENTNVVVTLNSEGRTEVLYAMLHTDKGVIGTYEFPGADGPVKDSAGNVITPSFNVITPPSSSSQSDSDEDDSPLNFSAFVIAGFILSVIRLKRKRVVI